MIKNRFRELDQRFSMWDTATFGSVAQNDTQVDDFVMKLAARTEQLRMAGRSVEALIKR